MIYCGSPDAASKKIKQKNIQLDTAEEDIACSSLCGPRLMWHITVLKHNYSLAAPLQCVFVHWRGHEYFQSCMYTKKRRTATPQQGKFVFGRIFLRIRCCDKSFLLPSKVQIFLILVLQSRPLRRHKSATCPQIMEKNHMQRYGKDENRALLWISLCKIAFMYSGNSVSRRWKPQLFPKLATKMAQKGIEVKIAFHGTGSTCVFAGWTWLEPMSATSAWLIQGWPSGMSDTRSNQRQTHTKPAPPWM